jgi:hypothetical protein
MAEFPEEAAPGPSSDPFDDSTLRVRQLALCYTCLLNPYLLLATVYVLSLHIIAYVSETQLRSLSLFPF